MFKKTAAQKNEVIKIGRVSKETLGPKSGPRAEGQRTWGRHGYEYKANK